MTENTVNIPLLRKAVEWAEAEAAKPEVDSEWYQPDTVIAAERIGRKCGTCYCIAGYLALVTAGPEEAAADPISLAFAALGTEDVGHLFRANNSITDVRRIAEEIAGERL